MPGPKAGSVAVAANAGSESVTASEPGVAATARQLGDKFGCQLSFASQQARLLKDAQHLDRLNINIKNISGKYGCPLAASSGTLFLQQACSFVHVCFSGRTVSAVLHPLGSEFRCHARVPFRLSSRQTLLENPRIVYLLGHIFDCQLHYPLL